MGHPGACGVEFHRDRSLKKSDRNDEPLPLIDFHDDAVRAGQRSGVDADHLALYEWPRLGLRACANDPSNAVDLFDGHRNRPRTVPDDVYDTGCADDVCDHCGLHLTEHIARKERAIDLLSSVRPHPSFPVTWKKYVVSA